MSFANTFSSLARLKQQVCQEAMSSAVRMKKLVDYFRARDLMGFVSSGHLDNVRFGFFGEFGFGLALWLPYLNYLKSRGLAPIKTCGPVGSRPFYYFSDDHLELPVPTLNGWGDEKTLLSVRKQIKERLVCPSSGIERSLRVDDEQWLSNELKRRSPMQNYAVLRFDSEPLPELPRRYCVVCVKDYYNWANTEIRNFYTADDLCGIAEICAKHGTCCVLNRFPEQRDNFNIYTDAEIVTEEVKRLPNVIDLADVYAKLPEASARNSFQLRALRHSQLVFGSQGGNGILALTVAPASAILMRGGFDYPTLDFLRSVYARPCSIAYEAEDIMGWADSWLASHR